MNNESESFDHGDGALQYDISDEALEAAASGPPYGDLREIA